MTISHLKYKVLLLIAVITVISYANSFNNGFHLDDEVVVTKNPFIKDLKNIPSYFLHPEYYVSGKHKDHYRPLVSVSYTIDYAISGLHPAGYRATNLLFHIGTSFILFLIVKSILGSHVFIAIAASLIFAVHPFNTEIVNFITARSSVMSSFFYLLAFYFWVKYRDNRIQTSNRKSQIWYAGSLFAFILGLLSKEVSITLPLSLFLYDIYFIYTYSPTPSTKRRLNSVVRSVLVYIPFLLIVIVPVIVRSILSDRFIPNFQRDIASQTYTMLPVLVRYLKLLLLPIGLNIAHYVKIYHSLLNFAVITSALILLLYIIIAIYLFRTGDKMYRLLSFFMIWFMITLLPIIIIPLNYIMQENRCYISSLGFAIFLSIVLWRVSSSAGQRLKLAYGLLLVIIVLYGTGTVYRNMTWQDGIALWTDALEKAPQEPRIYHNLSVYLIRSGNYDQARDTLYRGIRLFPDNWQLHFYLGRVFIKNGELSHALREYETAEKLNPAEAMIYNDKGHLFLLREEVNEAIGAYQKAIEISPDTAFIRYNMAKALDKAGRLEDSRRELEEAMRYAVLSDNRRLIEKIAKQMRGEGIEKDDLEVIQ